MKKWLGSGMLLLTAIIWGVAFVAQSVGMDYVEPFTFNFARYIIGAVVLLPFLKLGNPSTGKKSTGDKSLEDDLKEQNAEVKAKQKAVIKKSIIGGIGCGFLLCIASMLQQFGIMYTNVVGKAGFITALYIIIVPILGIFMKKRVAPIVWGSSVIAVIGFYMLSISGQVNINKGDILVLICAILFSVHILVIDYFSPKGEGVTISCIQFITCGILCGILMFIFETPHIGDILAAYLPILYAGVMSCGVAYTLQIVGQKNMDPTVASLILSLESVFSALAGWLILGQGLTARELVGCSLVFVAVLLAQMPQKEKKHG